jgi:hypothetical protein
LTNVPVPLEFGDDGVIRVRGTRVTLETVLSAFADGVTAEEIAQRYPSISLAGTNSQDPTSKHARHLALY